MFQEKNKKKIPGYKTYKFGKIIISKINNEMTLSYKGKKKIYSRIFCLGNSFSKLLKYIGMASAGVSVIFILVLSFYYISQNINLNSNQDQIANPDNDSADNIIDNSIDKDEKEKNELLLSDKTDYTEVKDKPLRISEYIIKKDDALSGIAKKFGVSMDTICGSNNLFSYDIIQEGKKLKIPNKDGILHKIEKGQNISNIAQKYKISIEKIFAENNIKNFDFISPGGYIFLPDAKPQNIIPGFLWPVAGGNKRITSAFGWRRDPINGGRQFHQGVDIGCNFQEIRAVKYGRVTFTGWMGGYGNIIIIAHPNGWKSVYGHLSRIYVNKGQSVKQGQSIGRGGNTGYTTGPHLHFELIQYNKPTNPLRYLTYKNMDKK